jgi:hypothetical protein
VDDETLRPIGTTSATPRRAAITVDGVRLTARSVRSRSNLRLPTCAGNPNLELLLNVANLWGELALKRFRYVAIADDNERSRAASALQGLRH